MFSYFSCLFLSFPSSTTRCLIVVSGKRMKIVRRLFYAKEMWRNWPRRVSARRSQRSDTHSSLKYTQDAPDNHFTISFIFLLVLFSFLGLGHRLGSIALDVFEQGTSDFAIDQPRIMVYFYQSPTRLNSSGK